MSRDQREYVLLGELKNEGYLAAHHWALRVAIPEVIGKHDGQMLPYMRRHGASRIDGLGYSRYRYLSERSDGRTLRILPGETLDLRESFLQTAQLVLSVGSHDQQRIMEHAPAVYWELFVDDAPKQKGELPYADWCDF